MSSRLYRAIVGVGISLGASGVACLGTTDDDPSSVTEDGGSETSAANEAGADSRAAATADAGAPDARALDATVDVTVTVDAAVDAPKDVILDAFCDATWPTTKGSPGGPTCGPVVDCADAGPAPGCVTFIGDSVCTGTSGPLPAWCIDSKWECSTGSMPQDQCKCWGPLEAGATCP